MTKKPTSAVISEGNSQTGPLIPDNAPPPNLGTEAAAQSVNIDGSGLRIPTPVLKRKREKERVEFSSISQLRRLIHYLLQRYN